MSNQNNTNTPGPITTPQHSNSAPTVFGKTMKIIGEVTSDEELQLDGELEGKLSLKGKLTIGPTSIVAMWFAEEPPSSSKVTSSRLLWSCAQAT